MGASLVYLLPPGAADVDPTRPRWRSQGRRTPGPPPSGRGTAPPGTSPRHSTSRPGGAGRSVPATPPPALDGVLRHPGDAASMASATGRSALDVRRCPAGPATGRQTGPRPGAATGWGERLVGAPQDPGRTAQPG